MCIGECPDFYSEIRGSCRKCESPCDACSGEINKCTSCDGSNGLKYRFGYKCLTECPAGTMLNETRNSCDGCRSGCQVCDFYEPWQCLKCNSGQLSYGEECF